jgi:glycerate dehydrogenase
MNIVVLDGFTLNPGDLNWEGIKALGDCKIYDRSPPEAVIERAQNAEIVFTNKTVLNRETIQKLLKLKYIGVLATGYNVVDIVAARERNVPVANIPSYGTKSVAQMTMALILELTQHVGHHAGTVRDGRWMRSPDFCYWDYPLIELEGLTLGLVGYGRIGQAVGELAQAFGMKLLINKTRPPETVPPGVRFTDLDTVFRESDIVTLHCPLTAQNKEMVNAERLASMKRTAFLINTSRGPLVNEAALAKALNEGTIAGAAVDVLAVEPPKADNPLFGAKNCIITPHIAWATHAARARLMEIAVTNLKSFLAGKPVNVVN